MSQPSRVAESSSTQDASLIDPRRIGGRLKLYFAVLACLSGLVLTSGTTIETISLIAVFFALFGYVCVDWLELFALPPIAAYTAMGLAALYCVSDFVNLDAPGNHQMIAVAQLLVFVQSILMLQRKTRRILEQLGVFCLLELIVAAVFNNAINFGVLLVPISVVGAWALSSFAALSASDGIVADSGLDSDIGDAGFRRRTAADSVITISAPESGQSLAKVALRLPRVAIMTVAPAVLLVGTIFFYALPRTTEAARSAGRGEAMVGFSDEMRLEQIGEMMQSSQPAMRVRLTKRSTGLPYQVDGGMYLRGRVLEHYRAVKTSKKNSALWSEVEDGKVRFSNSLPREFIPRRSTDENFYDAVKVQISCESSRSEALFTIAPYYRGQKRVEARNCIDRFTIERNGDDGWLSYPRITYEFGTHAFLRGEQTKFLAVPSAAQYDLNLETDESEASIAENGEQIRQRALDEKRVEKYMEEMLVVDTEEIPTAAALAEKLAMSDSGERESDFRAATKMENYLAASGEFGYTLKLDFESYPGMDPIEQFLLIDKRGHCQYFASALVMMLRTQHIPARIVVGYQTDEFNEVGGHYVVRQLHAHAWVEALIQRSELDGNRTVYGQPDSDAYWVRLDPTPGAGRGGGDVGGVNQVLDMAQNIWDDYVIEMDGTRQENAFLGRPGINPMHRSYAKFVDQLSIFVGRIRAGELGGGSLAGRNLFSWPAAVIGVVLAIMAIFFSRMPAPAWLRRKIVGESKSSVAQPEIPFYVDTLRQLSRVGLDRTASQTPSELAVNATAWMQHPMVPSVAGPLSILTDAYYRRRYGKEAGTSSSDMAPDLELHGDIEHAPSNPIVVKKALAELTRSVDLLTVGQEQKSKSNASRWSK